MTWDSRAARVSTSTRERGSVRPSVAAAADPPHEADVKPGIRFELGGAHAAGVPLGGVADQGVGIRRSDGVSANPRVQLVTAGRLVDCRLYGDRSGAVCRNA